MKVVSTLAISGRFLAASMKCCVLPARKAMSFPPRSSNIKLTPPEVPTPGIAGGGNRKAFASGIPASRSLTFLKIDDELFFGGSCALPKARV